MLLQPQMNAAVIRSRLSGVPYWFGCNLNAPPPATTITNKRYINLGWYTKKRRRPPPSNKHHYTGSSERKRDSIAKTIKKQNISKSNSNYNCYTNSNRPPFSAQLFFNPWIALADVIPTEDLLCDKVESTTRTFGIVAALMASLAAALITFNPSDGYDTQWINSEPPTPQTQTRDEIRRIDGKKDSTNDNYKIMQQPSSPQPIKRRNTLNFIEHVTYTHHVSGTSLLSTGILGHRKGKVK